MQGQYSSYLYNSPWLYTLSRFSQNTKTSKNPLSVLDEKYMRLHGNITREVTLQVIKDWDHEKRTNIYECMEEISLGIMARSLFGKINGESFTQVKEKIKKLISQKKWIPQSVSQIISKMTKNYTSSLRETVYQQIYYRRQRKNNEKDILSMLIQTQNQKGQKLSEKEIYKEITTIIQDYCKSSSRTLSWAIYWIYQTPDTLENLMSEIKKSNSLDKIVKGKYLHAVCLETLRLNTSFFEQKKSLVSEKKDPSLNRSLFSPEKFLDSNSSSFSNLNENASSTIYQMKIVLATILQKSL